MSSTPYTAAERAALARFPAKRVRHIQRGESGVEGGWFAQSKARGEKLRHAAKRTIAQRTESEYITDEGKVS